MSLESQWKQNVDLIRGKGELFLSDQLDKVPTTCPVCKSKSLHFYIYTFNKKSRRSSMFIWCNTCKSWYIATIRAPDFWKDIENLVDVYKPETFDMNYIESNVEKIDAHVNELISRNR
jgi:hypothetical protein